MRSEWKEVRLGDIAVIKGGKRLPKGKSLISEKTKHPYIRVQDLNNKRIIQLTSGFEYVDDETFQTISRYIVDANDVIISIVGTIGLVAIVDSTLDKANLTENCAKIVDLDGIDNKYLYYFLVSHYGQNEIKKGTVGAVQAKLPLKNIQDILIPMPPISEQRAIVSNLICLDDKIELNNKMNVNLEAQAQAIFKSWFVEFEPFQNGEFVDSELGWIPKGWQVGKFTDIVNILGGGTPKTTNTDYWNGEIPFFTPKDVKGVYTLTTEKYITTQGVEKCNSLLYPVNTVFITARGTVGKITLAGSEMAMNQSCYALQGKGINQFFVYGMANKLVRSLRNKSNGAVFNAIVTRDFQTELVVVPSDEVISRYGDIVAPLFMRLLHNSKQNKTLITLRDALLPKLMSGEIEVPNINEEADKRKN